MPAFSKILKKVTIDFKDTDSDVIVNFYKEQPVLEINNSSICTSEMVYLKDYFAETSNIIIGALFAMRAMYTEFNYTGDKSCVVRLPIERKLGDPLTVVTIETKDENSYTISWEEEDM